MSFIKNLKSALNEIDTYSIEAVKKKIKDGEWETDDVVKAGEKIKVVDKKDGGQTGTIMVESLDENVVTVNKAFSNVEKALSRFEVVLDKNKNLMTPKTYKMVMSNIEDFQMNLAIVIDEME